MSRPRPATMRDVAADAGVSPATVSRVLNDSGYVRSETRQRILETMQRLGYQPDWRARGLRGKEVGLIGLLIPMYSNYMYAGIAQAIADRLRAFGYNLILCVSEDNAAIDREYLTLLREKGVDGLIYSHPSGGCNQDLVRQMASDGMPIVELFRRREADLLDAVVNDDSGGAYQVTNYLIGRGHRRIALIQGAPDVSPRTLRLEGYLRALDHAGLTADPDLVRMDTYRNEHAAHATGELLRAANPPTAILAFGGRILLGTLGALQERGVRIPEDISIATFDDLDWLSVYNPPITGVAIRITELANAAVDVLQDRIAHPGSGRKPSCYTMGTSLIERDSCSVLRVNQHAPVGKG